MVHIGKCDLALFRQIIEIETLEIPMEKKQHGIAFTNLIKKKGWFLHLDYRPLIGRPRHPPPPLEYLYSPRNALLHY